MKQVATRNDGILRENAIVELSVELSGSALTAAQIETAFGDDAAVDESTFIQWWRGDKHDSTLSDRYAPRSVLDILNGIKQFQGIDVHRIASQDTGTQDELSYGEALVQDVAKRVLQVASEKLLAGANGAGVMSPKRVATASSATTETPDAMRLAHVPDDLLRKELTRREKASQADR